MARVYFVVKTFYGDFDVPKESVVAASVYEGVAKAERDGCKSSCKSFMECSS